MMVRAEWDGSDDRDKKGLSYYELEESDCLQGCDIRLFPAFLGSLETGVICGCEQVFLGEFTYSIFGGPVVSQGFL